MFRFRNLQQNNNIRPEPNTGPRPLLIPNIINETWSCSQKGRYDEFSLKRWIEGQIDHRTVQGPSGMCQKLTSENFDEIPCYANSDLNEHIILPDEINHKMWSVDTNNFKESAFCKIEPYGVFLESIRVFKTGNKESMNVLKVPITPTACTSQLSERLLRMKKVD